MKFRIVEKARKYSDGEIKRCGYVVQSSTFGIIWGTYSDFFHETIDEARKEMYRANYKNIIRVVEYEGEDK